MSVSTAKYLKVASPPVNTLHTFGLWKGGGALCVEKGFYADISKESRCNSEIQVWAHFYKILAFLVLAESAKLGKSTQDAYNLGKWLIL